MQVPWDTREFTPDKPPDMNDRGWIKTFGSVKKALFVKQESPVACDGENVSIPASMTYITI